jgi:hypothetical protein
MCLLYCGLTWPYKLHPATGVPLPQELQTLCIQYVAYGLLCDPFLSTEPGLWQLIVAFVCLDWYFWCMPVLCLRSDYFCLFSR